VYFETTGTGGIAEQDVAGYVDGIKRALAHFKIIPVSYSVVWEVVVLCGLLFCTNSGGGGSHPTSSVCLFVLYKQWGTCKGNPATQRLLCGIGYIGIEVANHHKALVNVCTEQSSVVDWVGDVIICTTRHPILV
jgi:hypothetical protein